MRKSILFLVIIFTFTTGLFAQNQKLTVGEAGTMMNEATLTFQSDNQITIRFNLNELELIEVETGYGTAFIATSNKAPWMLQEGAPELFYLTSAFIIPDTGGSELEISHGEFTDFENIEIAPSKGNLIRSIDPKTIPFVKGDVYQENEFYPGTLASLKDPFIMRDVRGQSVDVYPVQYNPVTKILRVYSEITVTINNTRRVGVNEFTNQKRHNTIDPAFNQMYNNLFLNYDSLSRSYPTGEEGELLIICHPAFMADMKPYIDWKRTIGRKTTIVSTATIETTGDDITEYDIKNYIVNYYDSPNNNLAYVLLVGDASKVPTNAISNKGDEPGTSAPSDNLYAQLAGNDHYLEILIGRMSADVVAHVQTQVQRTIHYERDLTIADFWLSVGMGVAGTDDQAQGHDGGEAYHAHMDSIRDRLLTYGYTIVHRDYKNCPDPDTDTYAERISQRINDGVGIINYCGHGDADAWEVAEYQISDVVDILQNIGMLPYIFSSACLNGNFTYPPFCFAEAWMRATQNNQPTGAIATCMASRKIRKNPSMTAQDEFVNICIDLPSPYDGQQPGIKRTFAGAALNATQKALMVYGTSSENVADFNSWTVFGDPTLMIRTKTPQVMAVSHPPSLLPGTNSFTVSCDTEGALAAISYIDGNDEVTILGTAVVTGGTAKIVFNEPVITSMDFTLAVTGFNKVTYIGTVTTHGTIINTNTTWNSNTNIYEDIVIINNSTLTINNCIISLCDNVSIFVHPGSKLIVNGSTLTNGCSNAMWQGITVLSDPDRPLSQNHQGYVEIINSGTIANAICGITVNGGGIVEAMEANFVNNTISVHFEPLASRQSGVSGKFARTNFVLNNNYLGNTANFETHLKMESSGSVHVQGCNFSSTAPHSSGSKNRGINVFNAYLEVKEYCPAGFPYEGHTGFCVENARIRNEFSGFSYAIAANNTGTASKLKVRFSRFEDNFSGGIYLNGSNHSELIKNWFIINQHGAVGISLRYATGYKIEENIFEDPHPASGKVTTGLRISNSGSAENEIYNNIFENLNIAQQFTYKNSSQVNTGAPGGPDPTGDTGPGSGLGNDKIVTGLQTLCNTFNNSQSVDILVGGGDLQQNGNCIRKNQGGTQSPAGNWFNNHLVLNIDNTQSQHSINYYYDENAPDAKPNNVAGNIILIPISISNPCPSKLGAGIIIPHALAQYDEWNTEYEYWLAELKAFKGDHEEEYDYLLEMASYYSALKDNHFNSIIIAIDNEIQSSMRYEASGDDEKIRGLDNEMMKNISHSSPLTSVEGQGNLNLRTLLLYRGNYADYLSVVETYLKENNYREAMITLVKMYERFEITEEQALELNDLRAYIHWLLQLEEEENTIYTLSDHEIEYLINYVETHTGRGRVFAKIILCELYEICIEDEEEDRKGKGDERISELDGKMMKNTSHSSPLTPIEEWDSLYENITIHPNPTTGELQVTSYGLQIDNIEIRDAFGRIVSSHHLMTPSSHHKIDISYLNSGVYFVKIITKQGEVVKKVVKQ